MANVNDLQITPYSIGANKSPDVTEVTSQPNMSTKLDVKTGDFLIIENGWAPDSGVVEKIEPPYIYVRTGGWGVVRFNEDGTVAEELSTPFSLGPFPLEVRHLEHKVGKYDLESPWRGWRGSNSKLVIENKRLFNRRYI